MIRSMDIEEKAWPGLERAFRTDSSSQNVRAVCSFEMLAILLENCNLKMFLSDSLPWDQFIKHGY